MRALVAVAVVVIMSGCISTTSQLSTQEKAQVVVGADTETLCRMALTLRSYKVLAETELGLRNATCDWRHLNLARRFVSSHYGSGMSEERAGAAAIAAQQMGTGAMPHQVMQPIIIPPVCKTTYQGGQIDHDC
jgi:hypothetical protein